MNRNKNGFDNFIRVDLLLDIGNVILLKPTFHPSSLNTNTLGKRFLNLLEALSGNFSVLALLFTCT